MQEAENLIGHKTLQFRDIFEKGNQEQSTSSHQDKTRPPPRKLKEFKPSNIDER